MDALEILSFNEQSTFDTSALFGWIKRHLSPYEAEAGAEVSKVDYPSKTKSSNVRGVGTIFDAFLNSGHSFSYKLKKFMPVQYCTGLLIKKTNKFRVACRPDCLNFKTEAVHADVYSCTMVYTAVFCSGVHYSTDTKNYTSGETRSLYHENAAQTL